MSMPLAIDKNSKVSISTQIYMHIRQLIVDGKLHPGDRLTSTRVLAKMLNVSRTSVGEAYDQLLREGYIYVYAGSGAFVTRFIPDQKTIAAELPADVAQGREAVSLRLSAYGGNLMNNDTTIRYTQKQLPVTFTIGRPDLDAAPIAQWRQLLKHHCRNGNRQVSDYPTDAQGLAALRKEVAAYLQRSRGIACDARHVVIVAGSQQAISLSVQLLIDAGQYAAVENPGWRGAQQALIAHGVKLVPLAVDEEGVVLDDLLTAAYPVRLVYTTPAHQFPSGAVLSLSRRQQLLQWAGASNGIIIEDDYDSEYFYSGRPLPALKALDVSGRVIYAGTFSKMLFPSLRLGYVVLPEWLVDVFGHAKFLADSHCPMLAQHVMADLIGEGHFEGHVRAVKEVYNRRRQELIRALNKHLGQQVSVFGQEAGMHLMIRLRCPFTDAEVVDRAESVGVGLVSTRRYYICDARTDEYLIGFGDLPEEKIEDGIQRLAQALAV
jgi:GntR family transcriptional regulator / MocR family aminotransferase